MSDVAIRVENLGKSYRIGTAQEGAFRYRTLRDSVTEVLRSPFGRLRSLSSGGRRVGESTFWALKDVSVDVKRGDIVGIIGRNGAGKTTLLKILSRITEPTEGSVTLEGRVGSLLEVGTGFHPELTGRENIYLNGAILGMRRYEIDRKFDEIVAFAEIEKFLDTPVKHYSSGMYVRLAFSVAAHLEPEILLVDEVLAVGDAAFQKKCLGKMGNVAKEGRTILFVSHNMGAISSLCKWAVVLAGGRVETIGDVSAAVATYLKGPDADYTSESLIDHPNRKPGFEPMLTSFHMELDGDVAYYGRPLRVRIGYQFDRRVAVPQFCVLVRDIAGVRAFTLVSDYQPNSIPETLDGSGEVECTIESLPLLPGDYTIDLMLWQPGQKLDDIEDVAKFRVDWLERELGQFNWNSGMGLVYVDASWRLSDANEA